MTKERPILFTGDMVRALLDGSKTQTRRAVSGSGAAMLEFLAETTDDLAQEHESGGLRVWCDDYPEEGSDLLKYRYGQPGDRLWVRETHYIVDEGSQYFYRATGGYSQHKEIDEAHGNAPLVWAGPWKPSIFMPRRASRMTLEITSVRVERLQDISEADAIAEGIERTAHGFWRLYGKPEVNGSYSPVASYRSLWESINGPGSWALNPWVWVIEFKRIKP